MKQQKRAKWTSSRLKGEKNVAEHVETDPRLNKKEKKVVRWMKKKWLSLQVSLQQKNLPTFH